MPETEKPENPESAFQRARRHGADRTVEIWDSLFKNNLWKRVLKNTVCTTILVSICLIPGGKDNIGRAAYLGAITTVFGHPGRRFGQMAESLILAVTGTLLAVSWSTLGLYLGSLVIHDNPQAAYTIRAIFLIFVILLHGYLRSRTPRLFIFVLLLIICAVVSLTSTATSATKLGVTQILYPIFIAVGVIILVNVSIFPEFSSRFLGQTTIDTLDETAKALVNAGHYFVDLKEFVDDKSGSQEEAKCSGLIVVQKPDSENAGPIAAVDYDLPHLAKRSSWQSSKSSLVAQSFDKVKRLVYSQTSAAADEKISEECGPTPISVIDLTAVKEVIRKKMAECKAAQSECNFELAVAVLPPRDLKEISSCKMKRLVANTIAVIGACESRYALLGEERDRITVGSKGKESTGPSDKYKTAELKLVSGNRHALENLTEEAENELDETRVVNIERSELSQIKARREIEFGDAHLLYYLLKRISKPYGDLHLVLDRTIEIVSACIAFVYDVPVLPSGANAPTGIALDELDIYIDVMKEALTRFDIDAAAALEGASIIQELEDKEPDIMPREEIFLISSFLLNVRQAAQNIEDMLEHCRELIERRQARHNRVRIYAPRIKWASWLSTGGEEDEALPKAGRKANRKGETKEAGEDDDDDDDADGESLTSKKILIAKQSRGDVEKNTSSNANGKETKQKSNVSKQPQAASSKASDVESDTFMLKLRGKAADTIEWVQGSEDLLYAMKLTVAVWLVLWPAFVARWNTWYSLNRGLWAALQLILILEVSIGTAINVFIIRGIGTTLGCLWGWAAVEARDENPIVCAVMICIGIIPCAYVHVGSKYPKAGIVGIISICVVSLASELETVPGTPTENFLKRYIAFMIGGMVAIIVEMVLLPVKARTRLVESLAAALQQIAKMEACIASGIEEGSNFDVFSLQVYERFENASTKANTALTAAETFLPFCSDEPRIKGSFKGLGLIYSEVLFVLHQIVDRMENMFQLRIVYGSGPLEDLNAEIYPYRRNIAGSVTLTLFAIRGALMTKLALPQFLPSARLAHLRMINRVREVMLEKGKQREESHEQTAKLARQRAVRRKYLSWNASSAAQAEIVEFLEELIDLTKLLVGANEFQSGLLARDTYLDYTATGLQPQQGETREEKKKKKKKKKLAAGARIPAKVGTEMEMEMMDVGTSQQAQSSFSSSSPGNPPGTTVRRRALSPVIDAAAKTSRAGGGGGRRNRAATTTSSKSGNERAEIPPSLKRIQSRKFEAGLVMGQKRRTSE